MRVFFLCCCVFFALLAFNGYSQDGKVWDYQARIFVEKKGDVYTLEWFHHRTEMETDTLLRHDESTYVGNKFRIIVENEQLYVKMNAERRKLKLKVSTPESIKTRNGHREFYVVSRRKNK